MNWEDDDDGAAVRHAPLSDAEIFADWAEAQLLGGRV